MGGIVIAIDGFSGTGKSSTAKKVASALGYTYIDSGAMYRCVARYFIDHQIDFEEEEEVIVALDEILISFRFNKALNASEILLNGQIMDHQIEHHADLGSARGRSFAGWRKGCKSAGFDKTRQ